LVQAKIGDIVKVHYTGRVNDGSTFDTSMHRDLLEFTLGDGELIPGIEKSVLGMNPGNTKTSTIPAYGGHRPEMVIEVGRQPLPPTLQPYVGQQLQVTQQDGIPAPVLVMAVTDAEVVVVLDGNHPLAGKHLVPLPAFQATPTPLPYPILRRLSNTSQRRAAPCSALSRDAPAGGGRGEKGRSDFLYIGWRATASDKSRFRQLGSSWGLCTAMGEFVLGLAAIVTGCSTEPQGRGPPKSGHSCGHFSV
jgi:peptidylprolyl isomerase